MSMFWKDIFFLNRCIRLIGKSSHFAIFSHIDIHRHIPDGIFHFLYQIVQHRFRLRPEFLLLSNVNGALNIEDSDGQIITVSLDKTGAYEAGKSWSGQVIATLQSDA